MFSLDMAQKKVLILSPDAVCHCWRVANIKKDLSEHKSRTTVSFKLLFFTESETNISS